MKYWGIKYNDIVDGEGICVSLWTSGCPFRCKGCHNQETWDKDSGYEVPEDLVEKLSQAVTANNITRNFSVLGGEPLAEWNRAFIKEVLIEIRKRFPSIKIFLWTGYTIEELQNISDENIQKILSLIDVLIDGRYDETQRDISLKLRGSRNQRILERGKDF